MDTQLCSKSTGEYGVSPNVSSSHLDQLTFRLLRISYCKSIERQSVVVGGPHIAVPPGSLADLVAIDRFDIGELGRHLRVMRLSHSDSFLIFKISTASQFGKRRRCWSRFGLVGSG